jgi:hypothetical protein
MNPQALSGELSLKLSRYTAVAGAGLAAAAAHAGIVVWTPVSGNEAQPAGTDDSARLFFRFQDGEIDTAGNKEPDFSLGASNFAYNNVLSVAGTKSNHEMLIAGNSYPARLVHNDKIDNTQTFGTASLLTQEGSDGNWNAGGQGFLGMIFEISGTTHYGWAEITLGNVTDAEGLPYVTLNRFGYNDVAGEGILAGQTAVPEPAAMVPMALLALGAAGFARYRQRQAVARN